MKEIIKALESANVVNGTVPMTIELRDVLITKLKELLGETELDKALDILQQYGIINSPDYWREHARPGCNCEGSYVAKMIMNAAENLK